MTPWATAAGRLPRIRWAAAFRPLSGESVSGDHHVVAPYEGGVLLAVVDALGHGADAEFASRIAVATLSSKRDAPIDFLLKQCHQDLSKTRGVAMAIAAVDFKKSNMTWVSVGNVEGVLVRKAKDARRLSIMQFGGIVGYQLPKIPPFERVPLAHGDRLCFATDGIKSGFAETINSGDELADLAAAVLEDFEDVRDDALVLIAEHVGESKK